MQIRVGFQMAYEFAARTPVVLMLNVHPSRSTDMIEPDRRPGEGAGQVRLFGNLGRREPRVEGETQRREGGEAFRPLCAVVLGAGDLRTAPVRLR